MFRLGKSTTSATSADRPLEERMRSAAYGAMAYWYYRWDWGESIAFDGLLATDEHIRNGHPREFVVEELRRWLGSAAGATPSPMGPASALLDLLLRDSSADLDAEAGWHLLSALADVVMEAGEQTDALTPERDGSAIFVDSLYGVPEFLVRFFDARDMPDEVERVLRLVLGHCRRLQRSDGLLAHFADLADPDTPQIAWGRGNGWAILGLATLLRALGPERTPDELAERCALLVDALVERQMSGGLWRNVIDDPASYAESSTTAMVTTALTSLVRDRPTAPSVREAADKGWSAIENLIDANGHLLGVSYRPGVNTDPARYHHTPLVGAYPWGQGAYLLAAAQRVDEY